MLKKLIGSCYLLVITLLSFQSYSIDLYTAQSKGLAGEQADGYLGVVEYSQEVSELVDSINKVREEEYSAKAQKENNTIQEIQKEMGSRLIRRIEKGQYYKNDKGKWIKK